MMHVEHCGMGDGENVGNRRGRGLSMNGIIESYPQPLDAPRSRSATWIQQPLPSLIALFLG